jgi:hypothetical protein
MGFLDKARKMAEQAQAKVDEVQGQFNAAQQRQRPGDDGPAVEYDQHGRPVRAEGPAAAPAAPARAPEPAAAAAPARAPAPAAAPASAAPRGGTATREDSGRDEYAPPPRSSGDPLEG